METLLTSFQSEKGPGETRVVTEELWYFSGCNGVINFAIKVLRRKCYHLFVLQSNLGFFRLFVMLFMPLYSKTK